MPDLSSKQRAQLRRLAHPLRPAIHIGKGGVSGSTAEAVEEAFGGAELLKVKVLESAPAPATDVARELAGRIEGAEVVQVLGRVATLYRRHPKNPRIELV